MKATTPRIYRPLLQITRFKKFSFISLYPPTSYAVGTQLRNVYIIDIISIDFDVHATFQKLRHLSHKYKARIYSRAVFVFCFHDAYSKYDVMFSNTGKRAEDGLYNSKITYVFFMLQLHRIIHLHNKLLR